MQYGFTISIRKRHADITRNVVYCTISLECNTIFR